MNDVREWSLQESFKPALPNVIYKFDNIIRKTDQTNAELIVYAHMLIAIQGKT